MDVKLDCALDLLRRLPPQNVEKNLSNIISIVPQICEDLLSSVDQPLKVAVDNEEKKYLLCEYNRDGDSYRSPWTNVYVPPLPVGPDGEGGLIPSPRLRTLEMEMNIAFDQYRKLYYGEGISSCYLWDSDKMQKGCFAGVVLLKTCEGKLDSISGGWDSIHVFEVNELKKKGPDGYDYATTNYSLTSTCMLWLQTSDTKTGNMNLGGSITRQVQTEVPVGNLDRQSHITNIGELIEDKENRMRNALNEIYFGKTKDIVNSLRTIQPQHKINDSQIPTNGMLDKLQTQLTQVPETSEWH